MAKTAMNITNNIISQANQLQAFFELCATHCKKLFFKLFNCDKIFNYISFYKAFSKRATI